MKTNKRLTLATVTTSIKSQPALAATATAGGGGTATYSTGQQTFTSTMTGSEEVPPKKYSSNW